MQKVFGNYIIIQTTIVPFLFNFYSTNQVNEVISGQLISADHPAQHSGHSAY